MKREAPANDRTLLAGLDQGVQVVTAAMLPPCAFSQETLHRLDQHLREGRKGGTWRWNNVISTAGPTREIIEISAIRDLVSGGLVHRAAWRFRISAQEVACALNHLCQRMRADENYQLALCRETLAFSFIVAGMHVQIDQHAPRLDGETGGGLQTRSQDVLGAMKAEFQRLWNSPQTIRGRSAVVAHLASQHERIFNRVIL
jgi:hypothetical protein